jgi:pimeloyl-ACP methyl ester carboxylesterase
MNTSQLRHIRTARLDVAYEESGPRGGASVVLLHGWPYDPRCYDGVVPLLVAAECRVLVPYLRGFGPTRFLSAETPRSGQQAALGHDLLEMMDVLAVERAILAGYDWGGRAACIVSALWPERVRGLVTVNGYNIQDIAGSGAARPGTGAPPLVSVVFSHRARTRSIGVGPPRILPPALAIMVAELEF